MRNNSSPIKRSCGQTVFTTKVLLNQKDFMDKLSMICKFLEKYVFEKHCQQVPESGFSTLSQGA